MVPTLALLTRMVNLIAADNIFLGDPNYITPVNVAFTPSPALEYDDITYPADSDFIKPTAVGGQNGQVTIDPETGDILLSITLASAPNNIPFLISNDTFVPNQIIYGIAWGDAPNDLLLATALFDNPVTFTALGQSKEVSLTVLRFPQNLVS